MIKEQLRVGDNLEPLELRLINLLKSWRWHSAAVSRFILVPVTPVRTKPSRIYQTSRLLVLKAAPQ